MRSTRRTCLRALDGLGSGPLYQGPAKSRGEDHKLPYLTSKALTICKIVDCKSKPTIRELRLMVTGINSALLACYRASDVDLQDQLHEISNSWKDGVRSKSNVIT